jgi:hypothetical protein
MAPKALDPPARVEGSKVSDSATIVLIYGSRTSGVKGAAPATMSEGAGGRSSR